MTPWIDFLLALSTLAAVLFVPGYLIARVIGLRGLWAVAVSGPASVTVVVMASLAAPLFGLQWGVVPVALVGTAILAVALALRMLIWRDRIVVAPEERISTWVKVAAVAAPLVISSQVLLMIGSPENISQTFDNIFHLNAVRYILDTGNASPLWVSSLTSAESGTAPSFYPDAWHALSALVVSLSGASIAVSSNALVIAFAAFVWTSGVIALTREFWGSRTVTLIVGAAASTCFPSFPLLLADYGVLFPYMMALSFVPICLALLIRSGLGSVIGAKERTRWLVALAGVLPALAVSHPGALVVLLAFAAPILFAIVVRHTRTIPERSNRKLVLWALMGAYLMIAGALWYLLRPPADARTWPPEMTLGQALGEVLASSVNRAPVNLGMALLVLIGLVAAVRSRTAKGWLVSALFLLCGALYITAAGMPYWVLRDILVGAWYNNIPRLAALLPLISVPLVAIGFTTVWDALRDRWRSGVRPVLTVGAMCLLMIVVFPLPQATSMRHAVQGARLSYAVTPDAQLLSTDELALLSRIDDEVPVDAVIVGSPWTGTALAYALSGRTVLVPHTLAYISPEMQEILDGLDTAQPGDEVCDLLNERNATYVLDFGGLEVNGGVHEYRGLDRLSSSDAVELVDREGLASLYRVTACE